MDTYDELMADRRARRGEDLRADRDRLAALNAELVAMLEAAALRVELANREGDSILSAWLPDARALIAKARAG